MTADRLRQVHHNNINDHNPHFHTPQRRRPPRENNHQHKNELSLLLQEVTPCLAGVDFGVISPKSPLAGLARTSAASSLVFVKDRLTAVCIIMLLMASYCEAKVKYGSGGLEHTEKSWTSHGTTSSVFDRTTSLPSHRNIGVASSFHSSTDSEWVSPKNDIPSATQPPHLHSRSNRDEGPNPGVDTATRAQLIDVLISTLEKLNVLNSSEMSCFRLDKVIHTVYLDTTSPTSTSSSSSSSSPLIQNTQTVFLHFQQLPVSASNSLNVASGDESSHSQSMLHRGCVSNPVVEVQRSGIHKGRSDGQRNTNGTFVSGGGESSSTETDGTDTPLKGRLSRTQIVVISTCSAIIGMFFLIAAFLRVRNYIKKSRLEQELARRPKFRSCSVALRGATQSMEQLRRDSLASKTSHQNSLTTQGSNGSHSNGLSRENSASSPRHDPDSAPLLLSGRTLQPTGPSTPTESHASLKYIDEDAVTPRRKVTPVAAHAKSDIHDDAREFGRDHQLKTLEGTLFPKEGGRAPSTGLETPKTTKQNGQTVRSKMEGSMNPSFSSGSISSRLIVRAGTPDSVAPRGTLYSSDLNKMKPYHEKASRGLIPPRDAEPGSRDNILKSENVDLNSPVKPMTESSSLDKATTEALKNLNMDNSSAVAWQPIASPAAVPQTASSSPQKEVRNEEQSNRTREDNKNTGERNENDLLPESSCFGLSQSEASLSSVTNQGKEFFGQMEYHTPSNGFELFESSSRKIPNEFPDRKGCSKEDGNVSYGSPSEQNSNIQENVDTVADLQPNSTHSPDTFAIVHGASSTANYNCSENVENINGPNHPSFGNEPHTVDDNVDALSQNDNVSTKVMMQIPSRTIEI